MREFSEAMRSLRMTAGLSQAEVGRRAGLDPSYVSRLERGEREPSSRQLVNDLASALELTMAERNALLVSAGYLPVEIEPLISSDPTLGLVADILSDPGVPKAEIDLLRDYLALVDDRRRQRRGR